MRAGEGRRWGWSGKTEAHQEGLPMVARPDRRSMAAVAGLGGRRRRRRWRRGVGRWCRACGGEVGCRRWPKMVARVEAVPGWRRTWRLDGRQFPKLLVVTEWGGVPEQRRWRRRSPGMLATVPAQWWRLRWRGPDGGSVREKQKFAKWFRLKGGS
jgi:hypothetical protein